MEPANQSEVPTYDNDNENDNLQPEVINPQLTNNRSKQRPISEKKMNRSTFRERKKSIKKRLSVKQRMSLDDLVKRNIHAGREDELYEKKPHEKSKKILQLSRRLSHRPRPDEIQDDSDLPPDLKIADKQYFKLYKYRGATGADIADGDDMEAIKPPHNRTSSDPNPTDENTQKNGLSPRQIPEPKSYENPLDWKFGQRSNISDLQARGIIPEQYADVAHGGKSLEEAKEEWKKMRETSANRISNRIDLKFRPSQTDLEDRGIWTDADIYEQQKQTQHQNKEKLDTKIKQRMDPEEAAQRAIIDRESLYTDQDELVAKRREENRKLKAKMDVSLKQRSDKQEVVERGVMDAEYFDDDGYYEDPNEVVKHKKSHKKNLTAQLDQAYGNRPSPAEMMNKFKNNQSLPTALTVVNSSNLDAPASPFGTNLPSTPEYNETDGDASFGYPSNLKGNNVPQNYGNYDQGSDSDEDDWGNTFIDRIKAETKQKRESLKIHHKKRMSVDDLEKRGILKPGQYYNFETGNDNRARDSESDEDDSQDEHPTFLDRYAEEKENIKKTLEHKHRRRPSMEDLVDRHVVPRGYFENMGLAMQTTKKRRKSFTTELATFLTNRPDIAEMLTKGLVAAEYIGMETKDAKRQPRKKRKDLKRKLNRKLNKKRRPTMDELEMRGIVPSGYFSKESNQWKSAFQKKHNRRLTAEQDIGKFLPKRMDPKRMMERGFIPKQHFQHILGMPIPIPTYVSPPEPMMPSPREDREIDEDSFDASNRHESPQQQPIVVEPDQNAEYDDHNQNYNNNNDSNAHLGLHNDNDNDNGNNRRQPSAIGKIVLDLPQHAERNMFNQDNWTQHLYESLLNSLKFEQITQRIQKESKINNSNDMQSILERYQSFEVSYHTNMNSLKKQKAGIFDRIECCNKEETEAMQILSKLTLEHSELEQKIRPQMKMLLHKMTLVETRIARLSGSDNENDVNLKREYEYELNYYDTYITELKNVFIHTNNIRSKYQNTIRTVMQKQEELDVELKEKEQQISNLEDDLYKKFSEFHVLISNVTGSKYDDSNDDDSKYDREQRDKFANVDLQSVLNVKTQNIDDSLDILSFRISTIPASDYAIRVLELCQLSYIYSNEKMKSFFEWFIRFGVQTFTEINYAHSCFNNKRANEHLNEEIAELKCIKFIAGMTPPPMENDKSYEMLLFDQISLIMNYLNLLPSIEQNYSKSNKYDDPYEYVVFQVARYLSADFVFSKYIGTVDETDIPLLAQSKVDAWVSTILLSRKANFEFNKDNSRIVNNANKPRNIIAATKNDSIARIRPSRAAAIVLDHAYGICLHG